MALFFLYPDVGLSEEIDSAFIEEFKRVSECPDVSYPESSISDVLDDELMEINEQLSNTDLERNEYEDLLTEAEARTEAEAKRSSIFTNCRRILLKATEFFKKPIDETGQPEQFYSLIARVESAKHSGFFNGRLDNILNKIIKQAIEQYGRNNHII